MKKALSLLLCLAMLLSLCAGALGETAVFTDDLGREVTVPQEISRIMVSGPLPQIYALRSHNRSLPVPYWIPYQEKRQTPWRSHCELR